MKPTLGQFLEAIRIVESGNQPGRGRDAIGDGGRALGPFQIWQVYWLDSGVQGRYEQVRSENYAIKVMLCYWMRFCPAALLDQDYETLARVHNGGPKGHQRAATLQYWVKVRKILDAM